MSEQFFELFDGQAGVPRDAAHRKCVDRIVTWDSKDADAIRHNDMLALTNDAKAGFF